MMYRVILDGNDLLDYQDKRYVLRNPSLEMEVNTAGSFSFSMHPSHTFYSDVSLLIPTIEVYEDEELIWFGRPVEIKTDFFKNKEVYCEGALAFFNDTIQRPQEFNRIRVHDFLQYVVDAHNAQVAPDRQFMVGEVTMENKIVYRNLRYESTFDVLKRQCLNAEGGYFFLRREDGVNYIDWLAEMPDTTNQPVEFGLNLLDISSNMDGSSLVTCVVPLGEIDSETGKYLTVESVNDGSDLIESEAVATFGRITKAVEFNGVYYPETLYEDGLEYLASKQFDDMVIECSAAELHSQNPNYETFRIGQMVRCHSVPHLLDREFPLIRMSIRLDTAAKKITLGSIKAVKLTEVTKELNTSIEVNTQNTSDMKLQVSDLSSILNYMTKIPSMEDMIGEITTDLDSIRDYYMGEGFRKNLEDKIKALDLLKFPTLGDQLGELLGVDLTDPDVLDRLSRLGLDPLSTTPITMPDLSNYLTDELNSYISSITSATDPLDLSKYTNDLSKLWTDRSSVYPPDSQYGDINSMISNLASKSEAIAGGTGSILDIKTDMVDMSKMVDGLSVASQQSMATVQDMGTRLSSMETQVQDLVQALGWRHQIDGTDMNTGVVNFVTTV